LPGHPRAKLQTPAKPQRSTSIMSFVGDMAEAGVAQPFAQECPHKVLRPGFSRQGTEESVATTCSLGEMAFRVKNTFIEAAWFDGEASSDDDVEGLPMMATKSCPASVKFATEADASKLSSSTSSGGAWKGIGEIADESSEDSDNEEQAQVQDFMLKPHVVPLQFREPEMSIGGSLHASGACKPCAWFWRPQGCDNGIECRHCHLCAIGELKARRRSKKTVSRRRHGHAARSSRGAPASAAGPLAAGRRATK